MIHVVLLALLALAPALSRTRGAGANVRRARLEIVTANIAGDPRPRELRDRPGPDLYALTEVARRTLPWLRRLKRYRRPHVGGYGTILEQRSPALVAHRRVKQLHLGELRMRLWWRFRRVKPPRSVAWGRYRVDGQKWRVACIHMPTGGPDGPNQRAWREEELALIRWVAAARIPTVLIGDFNASVWDLQRLADAVGGRVVRGTGPDHSVVIGCTAVADPLPKVKDWHGHIAWTITAPKNPRHTKEIR